MNNQIKEVKNIEELEKYDKLKLAELLQNEPEILDSLPDSDLLII